jgi:prophage antirepressor-like protein
VAKDACRVLGLHGSGNIARDIPGTEKGVISLMTPGGPQPFICVREAGLYRLISRSRKPAAQRFQAWLFNDVLPAIRQHGCYPPPAAEASAEPSLRELIRAELRAVLREELRDAVRAELAPLRAPAAPALPALPAVGEALRTAAALTIGLPGEDEYRTVATVLRQHRILTPASPRHQIGRRVSLAYQLEAARHSGDGQAWPPKPLRIDRAGNFYPPQAWAWLEETVLRIAGSMGYLPRPLAKQAGLFPLNDGPAPAAARP